MTQYTYIANRVLDKNGIADGASIYFYKSGTTTLIDIFSDDTYSTPLPNPIVLDMGAPVPNVYWDEVSVRVLIISREGEVVSDDDPYSPFGIEALMEPDGASAIGLLQGGTVQNAINWVTPEAYKATGQRAGDDTTAIEQSIVAAMQKGLSWRGRAGAVYRITSNITIDCAGSQSPIVMDLGGAKLLLDQSFVRFAGWGSPFLTTSFTAYPSYGDAYLSLASVDGIEVGDMIRITSPATTLGSANVVQYYVVHDFNGNDVFIEGTVVCDINPQQIIDSGKTGNIVVEVRKQYPGLTLKNGSIEIYAPSGGDSSLYIAGGANVTVSDLVTEGHARNHVYISHTGSNIVERVCSSGMGYIVNDQGYVNNGSQPGGLGYGYGIIHSNNARSRVTDCHGNYGWHTFDAAVGEMDIIYSNCSTKRNAFGFSLHEGSWVVQYIDCTSDGGNCFNVGRGYDVTIRGFSGRRLRGHGVTYSTAMYRLTIQDAVFEGFNTSESYPLYNSGGVVRPGHTSSGKPRVFTYDRVRITGEWLRNNFGGNLAQETYVRDCRSTVAYTIQGDYVYVSDNSFSGTPNYAFILTGPFPNGGVVANNHWGPVISSNAANSAMLLVTDSTDNINITGNINFGGAFLVRVTGTPVDLGVVKGNQSLRDRLLLGVSGCTALASDGNIYRGATPNTNFTITTQGVDLRVP